MRQGVHAGIGEPRIRRRNHVNFVTVFSIVTCKALAMDAHGVSKNPDYQLCFTLLVGPYPLLHRSTSVSVSENVSNIVSPSKSDYAQEVGTVPEFGPCLKPKVRRGGLVRQHIVRILGPLKHMLQEGSFPKTIIQESQIHVMRPVFAILDAHDNAGLRSINIRGHASWLHPYHRQLGPWQLPSFFSARSRQASRLSR